MRIYTKTGDDGTTGLIGGLRVVKCDMRVHAYGEVDELNAALGWCCVDLSSSLAEGVSWIQMKLFSMGAELATPQLSKGIRLHYNPIGEEDVQQLENWIDRATSELPELAHFILPGGGESGARLHLARTIGRRAERVVVALHEQQPIRAPLLEFLNRLSDLLFVWARLINYQQQRSEVLWTTSHDSK